MMAAVLAVGALGAVIGSFLNVVVYRVPRGLSVARPRSACGSCATTIRWYDNIPLVSWLVLRGRCRDCAAPIAVRYPLVELGTAVLLGVVAWRFLPDAFAATAAPGVVAGILQLVAYLYLAAISVALAVIDVETQRLPNPIVLPAYIVGLAMLGAAAVLAGDRTVAFREEPDRPVRGSASRRAAPAAADLEPAAAERFEALRAWRAGEAKAQGVPAYIVFGDATLRQVAVTQPQSLGDLDGITGIGAKKREAYGEALIRVVAGA